MGNVSIHIHFFDYSLNKNQIDAILPTHYPLASAQASPQEGPEAQHSLVLLSSDLRLRCRPGELYLGASTSNNKLHLKFFWDGNVFDDESVKEWLREVRDAVVWYLV